MCISFANREVNAFAEGRMCNQLNKREEELSPSLANSALQRGGGMGMLCGFQAACKGWRQLLNEVCLRDCPAMTCKNAGGNPAWVRM